jgi:hypothetical protein
MDLIVAGDNEASFHACDFMNQGKLGATTITGLLKVVWFHRILIHDTISEFIS